LSYLIVLNVLIVQIALTAAPLAGQSRAARHPRAGRASLAIQSVRQGLDQDLGGLVAGTAEVFPVTVSCSGPEDADPCIGTVTVTNPVVGGPLTLTNVAWVSVGFPWTQTPVAWTTVISIPVGGSQGLTLTLGADPFAPEGTVAGPVITAVGTFFQEQPFVSQVEITSQTNLSAGMPNVTLTEAGGAKTPVAITVSESGPSGTLAASVTVQFPPGVAVDLAPDSEESCEVTPIPTAQTLSCTGLQIGPSSTIMLGLLLETVSFAPTFQAQAIGTATDDRQNTQGQPNKVSFTPTIINVLIPFSVGDNFGSIFAPSQKVLPGAQLQQILMIQSPGELPAPFVTVTYSGPVAISSASGDFNCRITAVTNSVRCTAMDLDAGESAQIEIDLTATAPGAVADAIQWGSGEGALATSNAAGVVVSPDARRKSSSGERKVKRSP
jgi:hypothetical protein